MTHVPFSADDNRVESITVLTDDGEELKMRLGDEIELAISGPSHLLSHADFGRSLGLKIGVTYDHTSGPQTTGPHATGPVIATHLSE